MTAIAQAVLDNDILRARSQEFSENQVAAATAIARQFGRGAEFNSLFTADLDKGHVGVVQVLGSRFRFLAVPRDLYRAIADPFVISQRFPANFSDAGPLTDLEWDVGPLPGRSVEHLRAVLKSDDGPTLLGAAQAIVDGACVMFVRPVPDQAIVEQLWQLLPDSVRSEIRVATFANNNALGFNLLVASKPEPPCVTDEQAGDYPQGKYELGLQIAVESGDEKELARLLSRRSARQAMRLMLRILVAAMVIGLVIRVIGG